MINTMLIFKEYEYAYKCYAYKKYRSIIIEQKKVYYPFNVVVIQIIMNSNQNFSKYNNNKIIITF